VPPATDIDAALACLSAGDAEGAKAALRALLARRPGDGQANKLMAIAHGELHENEQSYFYIQRAAAAMPNDAEAQWMLANVAMMVGKFEASSRAYERVLRLMPGHPGATDGLAKCMISLGKEKEAMAMYASLVAANPGDVGVCAGYAAIAATLGLVPEAIAIYEQGLVRMPGSSQLQEELCYTHNFTDSIGPAEHRLAHEKLARMRHADLSAAAASAGQPPIIVRASWSFPNARDMAGGAGDGSRPLRVAFVTGDLGHHPCAFFLEGLVRALDRARVTPFWYAQAPANDAKTRELKPLAEFRDLTPLSDGQVAELAMRDMIDIAIDCNGWTGGHRLGALASRIAPVQMTYLGYPNTTGIETIDYRIVDAITDPPGHEHHCTERLMRTPGCFLCFTPQGPALTPAPRPPRAPIVFGSLSRLSKITLPVMQAWSRVLARVPGSTLLLNARIQGNAIKSSVKDRLASCGIDLARVRFREFTRTPDAHLRAYDEIDISLDTFPYNGTTTTFESLLMGVPVVTITGGTHRARVGASILNRVGLDDLAAADVEGYVDAAAALATDRDRLAALRARLPDLVRRGPLTDDSTFARGFESLLSEAWKRGTTEAEADRHSPSQRGQ
jgi:tetratricopeptide (TPR) repeat protein